MSNSNTPTISIVMPVYNGEKYLRQAVESILTQSYRDFEFIIVNDGSNDKTEEIIQSFNDQRIIYIKHSQNLGLARSLNEGIKKVQGSYIARMDADDVALPNRLKDQLSFMNTHPEIDIIGGAMRLIDQDGKPLGSASRPCEHTLIKWISLFSTPLFHPTVMAHSQILKDHPYDENMSNSEDYELWSRLLFTTKTQFANLKKPVLSYRSYSGSFTQSLSLEKKLASAQNTIENILCYINLSERQKKVLTRLRLGEILSISDILEIIAIYSKAATIFIRREELALLDILKVWKKVGELPFFFLKSKIKQLV